MAKILDLRNSGGQLVVIGESIALPTSNSSTIADTEPRVAGSIRYNPDANRIEFLSMTSEDWESVFVGVGAEDLTGYVSKAGDTMTGSLTLSGTARIRTPDGTTASPAFGFSSASTTGFALIGGAIGVVIGGTTKMLLSNASTVLSNTLIAQDGSAATPSVGFSSSSTTGLSYAASALVMSVAGTERARVTPTGITAALFSGVATSAQYADLAERYHADAEYPVGTVMVIGGTNEVTISTVAMDHRVAGIISGAPAYMMNSEAGDSTSHPYIALRGRVPCRVVGDIQKGDLLGTSDTPGCAQALSSSSAGLIVGKALANHAGSSEGIIEVLV